MNLIKSIFLILSLGCAAQSFAQTISDAEIQQLAVVACECVDTDNIQDTSMDDIEVILGLCIMEGLGKYPAIFEKISIEDEGAMEQLGERIGIAMLSSCPEVMMSIATADMDQDAKEEQDAVLQGTIQNIEGDKFTFVTIKTEAGRTEKLLWLSYFDGADELVQMGEKALNQKVSFTYIQIECYSNVHKEYINRKMITGISFDKE